MVPQLLNVVVILSGAVMTSPYRPDEGYLFTEADCNTCAIPAAKSVTDEWPADKAGGVMYGASKAAADQAMWKWREPHNVHPHTPV